MSAAAEFCAQFEPRTRTRTKQKRTKALSSLEIAVNDASHRARSGDWENSKGATFVGLHAMCHRMVYGILPIELSSIPTFRAAARNALRALHVLFSDDPDELAAFVRWTWEREKRKHSWALSSGIDRNRMSWKWQFSDSMVTDYKIYINSRKR